MNIHKFLIESNNPYEDVVDIKISRVVAMVNSGEISPKFAKFLLKFIMRKEIGRSIKSETELVLSKPLKDTFVAVSYSHKKTSTLSY